MNSLQTFMMRRGVVPTRTLGEKAPAAQSHIGSLPEPPKQPGPSIGYSPDEGSAAAQAPSAQAPDSAPERPAAAIGKPDAEVQLQTPKTSQPSKPSRLSALELMLRRSAQPDRASQAQATASSALPVAQDPKPVSPATEATTAPIDPAAPKENVAQEVVPAAARQPVRERATEVGSQTRLPHAQASSSGGTVESGSALSAMLKRQETRDPWRLRKQMVAARVVGRMASSVHGAVSPAPTPEARDEQLRSLLLGCGRATHALLSVGENDSSGHADGVRALALEAVVTAVAQRLDAGIPCGDTEDVNALSMTVARSACRALGDPALQELVSDLGDQAYRAANEKSTADERIALSARLAAWDMQMHLNKPALCVGGAPYEWGNDASHVFKTLFRISMNAARTVVTRHALSIDHDGATAYAQALARRCAALTCAQYEFMARPWIDWVNADVEGRWQRSEWQARERFEQIASELLDSVIETVDRHEQQAAEIVEACLLNPESSEVQIQMASPSAVDRARA